MNIFEFMSNHAFLTFLLACIAANVLWGIFVVMPSRIMRHWNIRKHGYPPVHCDADGDFREEED